MRLTKDKVFLLNEVFTKIKYDKMSGKYQIPLEAYIPLKLTPKQRKILEQMCIDNNIELVTLPERLSNEETLKLLEEYSKLKIKLNSCTISTKKEEIESEMYRIRNIIAEGHMELVLRVILKYFPNIDDRDDKEDIYQLGYEILLLLIEQFDLSKSDYFARFLYKYLIPYIKRRAFEFSNDLTVDDNVKLAKLIKMRELFEKKHNIEPTVSELQEMLDIPLEEVEELLLIEKRLDVSVYDEQVDLIEDSLEEKMVDFFNRDNVERIINTLPNSQKQCLLLYFGFVDDKRYTYDDIAVKLNMSHQAARQATIDGLDNIKNTARKNILSLICYGKTDIKNVQELSGIHSITLFYFLLKQFPKDTLLELMDGLSKKNKDTLILYLGLDDGIERTREELAQEFGITRSSVNDRIISIYNTLTFLISNMYKEKYKGTEREEYDLISNMLLDYINNSRKKVTKNKR